MSKLFLYLFNILKFLLNEETSGGIREIVKLYVRINYKTNFL